MNEAFQLVRVGIVILTVALLPLALGCGDSSPDIVPVSGQVQIDGEPLASGVPGFIQVIPSEGRAATGSIDPETGRFTLSTWEEGDGCLVGTHPAIVMMEQMVGFDSVSLIPEDYTDLESTPLKVTVEEPTDSLVIELTGPLRTVQAREPVFEGDAEEL